MSSSRNLPYGLRLPRLILLLVMLLPLMIAHPAWAEIQSNYDRPGLSGSVRDMLVFDAGGGERLYVAGTFETAEDIRANSIAAWDGARWHALPGTAGSVGLGGEAEALAIFDDGNGPALYIAGLFSSAGGTQASNIVRWDGSTWTPLGAGVDGRVYSLAVFDDGSGPALYAGGRFSSAGGSDAFAIARWDGSDWSTVGSPLNGSLGPKVYTLKVHDDGSGSALYAGGGFFVTDNPDAQFIARWDGVAWSAVGPEGLVGDVRSLGSFDDGDGEALFAGGHINMAGGQPTLFIARWDGSGWSGLPTLGDSPGGPVYAMGTFDFGDGPRLLAGSFSGAGATRLSAFDGAGWQAPVTDQPFNVLAFASYSGPAGEALVVGGNFLNVGERTLDNIGLVTGGEVLPMTASPPHLGVRFQIEDFAFFDAGDGPELYAAGPGVAGDAITLGVARRSQGAWHPVIGDQGRRPSSGLFSSRVDHLHTYDDGSGDVLIAAGAELEGPGAIGISEVLRWDGSDWTELGELMGSFHALDSFDDGSGPALYAAGYLALGPGNVGRLARWDGSEWTFVVDDDDIDGLIWTLKPAGGALYVGGNFTRIAGVESGPLASWDGQAWSADFAPLVHSGTAAVNDLEFFDSGSGPELYITGIFQSSGGVTLNSVARWDEGTSSWQPMGLGLQDPDQGYAIGLDLQVSDAGGGNALYAAGRFMTAGGFSSQGVARWDGLRWASLGAVIAPPGEADRLAAIPDGVDGPSLMIGGIFQFAGGLVSHSVAEFRFNPEIFSDGFESGDTSRWQP